MLQIVGETKFGLPDDAFRAAIESIDDIAKLEELCVRLVSAASWQEFLPLPKARRNRRRKE